jgi:hypothetical protein
MASERFGDFGLIERAMGPGQLQSGYNFRCGGLVRMGDGILHLLSAFL